VAVPMRRTDLGPDHAVTGVGELGHVARLDRNREARPAGMAVVLVNRGEQRFARYDVDVQALFLVVPELVPERRLGGSVVGDPVLLRGQLGDRLGVLAICHVSSFADDVAGGGGADGAARWILDASCTTTRGLRLFHFQPPTSGNDLSRSPGRR